MPCILTQEREKGFMRKNTGKAESQDSPKKTFIREQLFFLPSLKNWSTLDLRRPM